MTMNKKQRSIDMLITKISRSKLEKFCELLRKKHLKLSDDLFKIKRQLELDSKDEKYFQEILMEFNNEDDIIMLINFKIQIQEL